MLEFSVRNMVIGGVIINWATGNGLFKIANFAIENPLPIAVGAYAFGCYKFYNIPAVNNMANFLTGGKFSTHIFNPVGLTATTTAILAYGAYHYDLLKFPKDLLETISSKLSTEIDNVALKTYDILDNNLAKISKYLPETSDLVKYLSESAYSAAFTLAPITAHATLSYLASDQVFNVLNFNIPSIPNAGKWTISTLISQPIAAGLLSMVSPLPYLVNLTIGSAALKFTAENPSVQNFASNTLESSLLVANKYSNIILDSLSDTNFLKAFINNCVLNGFSYGKTFTALTQNAPHKAVTFAKSVFHLETSYLIDKYVGENHAYMGKVLGAASYGASSFIVDKASELLGFDSSSLENQ